MACEDGLNRDLFAIEKVDATRFHSAKKPTWVLKEVN